MSVSILCGSQTTSPKVTFACPDAAAAAAAAARSKERSIQSLVKPAVMSVHAEVTNYYLMQADVALSNNNISFRVGH